MGISIGNKLELVLLDQIIKNEKDKKVYVSKIYDFIEDDVLQIAMPIYEGKLVPLPMDEKYSLCFYTDKGLLQCNAVVTSRYKSGNLFFLEITLLGDLNKVQRREFYRYQCKLDARMRIVLDEEYEMGVYDAASDVEKEKYPVKILDISGGGIRLVTRNNIEKNEIVKIDFTLYIVGEVMNFSLFARVLDSVNMRERRDFYEQRLEFMKISQEERDKIIRFIFESERMERKKEIGGL